MAVGGRTDLVGEGPGGAFVEGVEESVVTGGQCDTQLAVHTEVAETEQTWRVLATFREHGVAVAG